MSPRFLRALRTWFPNAVAITIVSALIAVSVQQVLRSGADDPQIQLAEDAAAAISGGSRSVDSFASSAPVDIAHSVAPWVSVYDDAGRPLASSGRYAVAAPVLPDGVLAGARDGRERRVTWQPAPGVRSAVVVTRITGARRFFVVAGRSLRDVEARVDALRTRTFVAWLVAMAAAFAATWVLTDRARREPAPQFQT